MSKTIHDLLKKKGFEVYSVNPDSSIKESLQLMAEKRIGFVPILENGTIVGLYSERDFARLIAARDDVALDTPIREVMVSPVYFIRSHQSIDEGMAVMSAMHFRHLPVLNGDQMIGVVSIGDVIRDALLEMDYTIEQLENILWANLV